MGQEEALHRFVRSLKQECRAYVRLQGPQNLQQVCTIADRYESSQDDPDRQHKPDEHKQKGKQYDIHKPPKKEFPRAEGKQQEKTNGGQKKKFSGNCCICGKAGYRAQDCYKKASAVDGKCKANVAQGVPKQENE